MRTDPTFDEVLGKFQSAFAKFRSEDSYLLEHDVYEKSMTHKLAEYLQQLFPDWNVDCEYNRNGHEPKIVELEKETPDEEGTLVSTYPNIIVHERGSNDHNILVIEAKKSNDRRKNGERFDRRKLQAYASHIHYFVGIFLLINIEADSETPCKYDIFYDGQWHDKDN